MKKWEKFKTWLIFSIVGVMFAVFTVLAVYDGRFRAGRIGSDFISAQDDPIRFWLIVFASALMSGIALYCAFAKGKK
jgi:hypothetical protein